MGLIRFGLGFISAMSQSGFSKVMFRDVHDSIAMISKSRESSNFFPFFSYWSRIGLSQYGLESYRFHRYCIGKYRGHIGFVDIVLVKYRGHIGFVEIFEKKNFKIFPKKCPFLAKKCPFLAIFGQKMAKISSFFVKFREVVQNLAFFYRIGIGSNFFGQFFISYWYRSNFWQKMTLVLVLGRNFFRNFLYCIGLGWDFWTKIF